MGRVDVRTVVWSALERGSLALTVVTATVRLALSCALLLVSGVVSARERPLWSRRVGPVAGSFALAVDGDVVVTVTWAGEVVALDAGTGRVRWRVAAPAGERLASDTWLGLAGGVAVVGRGQYRWIDGYDVTDGRLRWQRDLGGAPTSLAACPGLRLVAATHRTSGATTGTFLLTALDPTSGVDLWEVPATGPISAADDGVLFTTDPSGIGPSPRALHATRCEDGQTRSIRTDGVASPVVLDVDGGRVLVVDHTDLRAVVAPLDGGPPRRLAAEWHVPGRNLGRLRGDRLYLSTGSLQEHQAWRHPEPAADSVLFVTSLASGAVEARSPPRTSSVDMLLVGSQIVTSFGGSGLPDSLTVLDADDLSPLAEVRTPHAPMNLVADGSRVYATQYDGSVLAVALPRPAPAPTRRVVTPRPLRPAPQPPAPSFVVLPERVIDAHPSVIHGHPQMARTLGTMPAGRVEALSFVSDGTLLATGGNDHRVRLFRVSDGRPAWASPPLDSAVDNLAAGGGRLAARIYGGRTFVWDIDANGRGRPIARLSGPWGSSVGLTPSGARVVVDDREAMHVLSVPSGAEIVRIEQSGTPDRTAMDPRGRWLVRRTATDRLAVIDLDAGTAPPIAASLRLPPAPEGATLVQAWARSAGEIVMEWCALTWCEVRLVGADGRVRVRQRFDTATGRGWDYPSGIDVSADGRWLFFHRDGLSPIVSRLSDGARVVLPVDEETKWARPRAAFSPSDPSLLAFTASPAPNQVTLFRIQER